LGDLGPIKKISDKVEANLETLCKTTGTEEVLLSEELKEPLRRAISSSKSETR
jgi:hypothetical protein